MTPCEQVLEAVVNFTSGVLNVLLIWLIGRKAPPMWLIFLFWFVLVATLSSPVLIGCWRFMSLQHLKSYQVRYRLVTAHSWRFYSAAPLENQAAGIMTQYPIQSHYPDTKVTSPCPILLKVSVRLESDKDQFCMSLVWLDRAPNSWSPERDTRALSILPSHLVYTSEKHKQMVKAFLKQLGLYHLI